MTVLVPSDYGVEKNFPPQSTLTWSNMVVFVLNCCGYLLESLGDSWNTNIIFLGISNNPSNLVRIQIVLMVSFV